MKLDANKFEHDKQSTPVSEDTLMEEPARDSVVDSSGKETLPMPSKTKPEKPKSSFYI